MYQERRFQGLSRTSSTQADVSSAIIGSGSTVLRCATQSHVSLQVGGLGYSKPSNSLDLGIIIMHIQSYMLRAQAPVKGRIQNSSRCNLWRVRYMLFLSSSVLLGIMSREGISGNCASYLSQGNSVAESSLPSASNLPSRGWSIVGIVAIMMYYTIKLLTQSRDCVTQSWHFPVYPRLSRARSACNNSCQYRHVQACEGESDKWLFEVTWLTQTLKRLVHFVIPPSIV